MIALKAERLFSPKSGSEKEREAKLVRKSRQDGLQRTGDILVYISLGEESEKENLAKITYDFFCANIVSCSGSALAAAGSVLTS